LKRSKTGLKDPTTSGFQGQKQQRITIQQINVAKIRDPTDLLRWCSMIRHIFRSKKVEDLTTSSSMLDLFPDILAAPEISQLRRLIWRTS
jgi:hypothetical protein